MKRLQSKAKIDSKSVTNMKKSKSSDSSDEEKATKKKPTAGTSSTSKFSFLSLKDSMNDKTLQVFKSDRFVCIRDKYPKARFHMLLIPTIGVQLMKVQDLIKLPDSLDFLKEIKTLAEKIIDEHLPSDCKSKAVCGFHAIQSMNPLHMHIITTDFKSDCLKNKKHWNSFNTPYYVKLNDLISNLEKEKDYFVKDEFNLNNGSKLKEYLNMDLVCNLCKAKQSNMPNLKKHLLTH
jgi:aprataxin